MKKSLKVISFIVIIIIVGVICYSIYAKAVNDDKTIEQKTLTETNYLEVKLVNIFNRMNNITIQNYKVTTNEVQEESGSGEVTGSGGNQENEQGGSSGSSSQGGSGNSQGGSSKSGETTTIKEYKLEEVKPLSKDREVNVNWDDVQKEIQEIYTVMPTITLDLYQTDINQEDILKFNNKLDELTIETKKEDKEKTLEKLCDMYSCITKFMENVSKEDLYKTTIKTKESVLKAYSKVDYEKWDEVSKELQSGIDNFSVLLTNTNINYGKQINVNKIYVILNELKNAAEKKDKEIFFIKYKNLLEEMNSI